MSLLKGDGFFDQSARPLCLDCCFILPDDEGAIIAFVRSHIMINRHDAWLLLHSRKKLVQKRFYLWKLFLG